MKTVFRIWIALTWIFGFTLASHSANPILSDALPAGIEKAPGVWRIGRIAHPDILESSGLVASRQYPGFYWTHNDGGGAPKTQTLYALNANGEPCGQYLLEGVVLKDWEDMAIDDAGHLYLGDIGNNDAKRDQLLVCQVDEPDPRSHGKLPIKRSWKLRFPAEPFDCEALFIWKQQAYLVSKVFNDQRAGLYRFPLIDQQDPVTLGFLGKLRIESPVTGADLSTDGKLLGLVSKSGAYVYCIEGDVGRVLSLKPHRTKYKKDQIEACCFLPDGLLATSESREMYLFTEEAYRQQR